MTSTILLVPLFVVDILPLHDYPNHLARMHVIRALDNSAILQLYYEIHWEVLPNLAMDIVVPALTALFSLEVAGKLFCAGILLSTVPAVAALHWALHRKLSLWPLAAALFAYNYVFIFGFLNYLAGVNLALAGTALWICFRHRPARWSLPLFAAASTLLFFTHLYALGLYGLAVLGYESSQLRETKLDKPAPWRTIWPVAAGQFLLPLGLFLLTSPTFGDNLSSVAASSLWSKIGALYSVFNTAEPSQDGYFFLIAGGGLVAVFSTGLARLHSRMRLCAFFLLLCFLLMPGSLFGSGYADYRLPLAALLFLIAGSSWTLSGERANRIFVVLLLAILTARIGQIAPAWNSSKGQYREIVQAIDRLPQGSKVFAYLLRGEDENLPLSPPLDHIVTLAVIRRAAFVPTLFAFPGKHPVRLTPAYRVVKDRTPSSDQEVEAFRRPLDSPGHPLRREVAGQYDFLFVFSRRPVKADMPYFYTFVAAGKNFELFRVQRLVETGWTPEREPVARTHSGFGGFTDGVNRGWL